MTFSVSFTIPGAPVPKGRARSVVRGKGGRAFVSHYTPTKTRNAEATLAARAMEFRPEAPLSTPLRLFVVFYLPIPASWSKKKKAKALSGELAHTSKPDVSNLLKLFEDALNGVFWVDDSQVFDILAKKFYSDRPRTTVHIEEVS